MLINASLEFEKGRPKNFIPLNKQQEIVKLFVGWRDVEGKCRLVTKDQIVKYDYNLSPTRYIQNGENEELKPVKDIVTELESLELESNKINKELGNILKKLQL